LITSGKTNLRVVEPDDIGFIYDWENNPEFWSVSEKSGPFGFEEVADFIQSCTDLNKYQQIRWIILDDEKYPVGSIDIFEFDHQTKTAGIGILIAEQKDRKKGFAFDALTGIIAHYKSSDEINFLRTLIYYDNHASLRLFRKLGFQELGEREFKGKIAKQFVLEL
jgi:diamine N-acetyltransferase